MHNLRIVYCFDRSIIFLNKFYKIYVNEAKFINDSIILEV